MDTEDHAQNKTTAPNLQGRGRNDKEELLLGDKTLGTEEELPLGDENPGTTTTTTPNLRGCGRTTTATKKKGSWDTAMIMGTEDHGHSKNHRHNNREDAQPPRLRRTKQASPSM